MNKVTITQKRSLIGSPQRQRHIMRALGFGRWGNINKTVTQELNPSIQGMINKVAHLVTVKTK